MSKTKLINQLFLPFELKSNVVVKNRLAVATMTTQQSNSDGTISVKESAWLERLASDGYGLVISCAATISREAIGFYNQLSVGEDPMIADLSLLAQRMKSHNTINLIQLCHAGSRAIHSLTGVKPKSASSYSVPMIADFETPEMLTVTEIKEIVTDFADACERVEMAGFDGVELHGANGFLITQFISSYLVYWNCFRSIKR